MVSVFSVAETQSKFILWLKELRATFCVASAMPVIIGTAIAYKHSGDINLILAILAVLAAVSIHLGANVANDYFDHISGNDEHNDNKTPFSGGSRMIQNNLLSPKEILTGSIIFLIIGAALGIAILIMTKSIFVLLLGLAGILGGFFYTAPPLKLGYRTTGEITIGFLFGILPVYGAYYIQTGVIDFVPLLPSLFVAVLIFLVIFANEFPDFEADKAVNKKTIVVSLGIKKATVLYKASLVVLCILAAVYSIAYLSTLALMTLLIPVIVISTICFKNANPEKLAQKGDADLSKTTILLHTIGCVCLWAAVLAA
ncbi:MAG: 1,4-dihydroxy-2-naphthoate octaprenyltransferase [Planctomycetes bacterium]|nr:1,4-dihydroxy-2-naphthoate octaprenyltransferase [Planctomycetota bacterium]MBU1517781.1 1,4-dihydroxy-2-naphthoate octaprenyltransferase [Planctomycetota bacterium]